MYVTLLYNDCLYVIARYVRFLFSSLTLFSFRSEKQNKEEIIKNTCFICGLERKVKNDNLLQNIFKMF